LNKLLGENGTDISSTKSTIRPNGSANRLSRAIVGHGTIAEVRDPHLQMELDELKGAIVKQKS
jgi:hypothetical protein